MVKKKNIKGLWNRFFVGLLNGIVIILPITLTVVIVGFIVTKVNKLMLSPLLKVIVPGSGTIRYENTSKVIIFFSILITISFIGWAARLLVVRRLFNLSERALVTIPILGKIYNSIRQIATAFLGKVRPYLNKSFFLNIPVKEYTQ